MRETEVHHTGSTMLGQNQPQNKRGAAQPPTHSPTNDEKYGNQGIDFWRGGGLKNHNDRGLYGLYGTATHV